MKTSYIVMIDDFKQIRRDVQVREFVERYDLKPLRSSAPSSVVGEWTGMVDGQSVYLKYRCYDPLGPFSLQPAVKPMTGASDGHKRFEGEVKFDNL